MAVTAALKIDGSFDFFIRLANVLSNPTPTTLCSFILHRNASVTYEVIFSLQPEQGEQSATYVSIPIHIGWHAYWVVVEWTITCS